MSTRPMPIFAMLLAGAAASAGEAPPEPLAPVVVTAALRPGPADTRPGGVSVLGAGTLREAGVVHLEEVLPMVPSLSWAGASSRPRYFQLRGTGELEQYQGAPNPSIGFLVDEIDFSGIGMIASLFDVEQVEVLRGPQGTRYGANALGGLIKVKTRDPAPVRSLDTEVSVGDDGLWSAGAAAGGPLAARGALSGAWRAVLQHAASDGFRDNLHLSREDTNARDETTARLRLSLGQDAPWSADLALLYADFDNGYDAFAIDNGLETLSDRPGRDAQRSSGAWLDLAMPVAAAATLRSITTFADSDIVASFDGDWGNDADWGALGPYDYFSETRRERRTLAEDLRLSGPAGERISWIAGLWLMRLEEDNRIADDGRYLSDSFVRLLDSRYRATSTALYGQADFAVSTDTTVTAGLRFEERDARYADSDGVAFNPSDRMWGGELSLTRRLDDRQGLWLSLARGFRAGGFNIGTSVPEDRQQFTPEYLWSVEAGWKGRSEDGDARADVNFFYMRREHLQVATSLQLDPEDPLTFMFLTDNAEGGEAFGLESSANVMLGESVALEAMLSWMGSAYDGYRFGERDLDNREFAHAPEWKAALAATWRHPAGWMARVDLSGEAGFYFDTSHDRRADSRFLASLRTGFEAERWSVELWGHNLFDERYPVRGFSFGNEPPDFPAKLYLRWGDPRQVGLTARYSF